MSRSNTQTTYGSVTKVFHWSIALGVFALIPLGIIANGLPAETSEQITHKALLFSVHKTLGLLVFFLALARIAWALSQPRPAPLNPDEPIMVLLAQSAHWLLYASLVLVPLSGWFHHAATTGFAPIWWPFGQSLPFIPKDAHLAELFGGAHIVFERVLVFTLFAHIAGALKHHVWDRDDTLRRMLPGQKIETKMPESGAKYVPKILAPAAALGVLVLAIGAGAGLGVFTHTTAVAAKGPDISSTSGTAAGEHAWSVESGEISITVRQLGSSVTGQFADWTAEIAFSEDTTNGRHGTARATISIPSLTLGSVTAEAMKPDYFDAETFPTATFEAGLLQGETAGTYLAEGELTIKDVLVPLTFPFELTIDGDTAEVELSARVDRRDFGIGLNQTDDATLGFEVAIEITLTATRAKSVAGD